MCKRFYRIKSHLHTLGKQMKTFMKFTLERWFPVSSLYYRAYKRLIKNQNSYLHLTGWMQSLRYQKPMDKNGNPIPWMNYSVVRLLEERLTHDLKLFEFGSGYSTLLYASKVRTVTSVEYDEKWFNVVKSQAQENVKLIFKEKDIDGEYCRVICSMKDQYDVVIVDGRDRVNCVIQSISALSPKGVIVLDDSQRDKYQDGIKFAKRNGFRALNPKGLKAAGAGIYRTTILYREENCLKI